MNQPAGDASTGTLERLEQETERLKSQLKRANLQISILQLAVLLVVAGLVGGGYYLIRAGAIRVEGLSPAVAKSVEAREFGLYNRFGTRVVLAADDKFGLPQLIFMDLKKNYRMGVKVWPEGDGTPGLVFYDASGPRSYFRLDESGAAALELMGSHQKGGIAMSVAVDGTPTLRLTDPAGKILWEAPTNLESKTPPAADVRATDRPRR
jgi:hypothetical protein